MDAGWLGDVFTKVYYQCMCLDVVELGESFFVLSWCVTSEATRIYFCSVWWLENPNTNTLHVLPAVAVWLK